MNLGKSINIYGKHGKHKLNFDIRRQEVEKNPLILGTVDIFKHLYGSSRSSRFKGHQTYASKTFSLDDFSKLRMQEVMSDSIM